MRKESEAMSTDQWMETLDKSVHPEQANKHESMVRGEITHEAFSDFEILKFALEDISCDHEGDAGVCYGHKWKDWSHRRDMMARHGDAMSPEYVDTYRYKSREIALLRRWMVQDGRKIPDGMDNVDPSPPPVWSLPEVDLVEVFADRLGPMCERIYNAAISEVSEELVDTAQWEGRDDYNVQSIAAQLLGHVSTYEAERLIEDYPSKRINVRVKGKWE